MEEKRFNEKELKALNAIRTMFGSMPLDLDEMFDEDELDGWCSLIES